MLWLFAFFLSAGAFPAWHVQDRWIYAVTTKANNRAHPDVEAWREEMTITAIEKVPAGTLIRRRVKLLDNTTPTFSIANWSPQADILVRGPCLWYLHGNEAWDQNLLADICLPLQPGAVWGDPNQTREHWRVAAQDVTNGRRAWRLEAHLASGDDNDVWFQQPAGIVATRTIHHGTYYDKQVRLLTFQPAK